MNRISSRQLYFFLACIAPIGKIVVMPTILAKYAGNNLLIPAAVQYLLQSAAIFAVLLLAKQNASFFALLKNTFGKVFARIVILIFSAFLFFAAFIPLLEQKAFVQATFYDTIPSLVAFAPFFLLCVYFCSKPLHSYGRTWDILGPLAIAGLIGILVLAVSESELSALLPADATGFGKLVQSVAYSFCWFFDAPILLMLLGKIDYTKGMAWKGAIFYLVGGLAVLCVIAVYYGVFQATSIGQMFVFSKISKYFSGITVLGRVDYIFIFALAFVLIFYVSLPLQAGIEGILQAFGRKKYLPTLLAIGLNAVLLGLVVVFDYRFGDVLRFLSEKLFWIFPVFALVLPALCLFLRRKRHERP